MDSKTRAKLRSLANPIEAILQVGKNGLGDALQKQVDDALTAREMIKLTVLETCPETPREMAAVLAAATGAEVVQVVGRKVTLYRKNPEKTILDLR
ncbi:MAG: ribosome assembly RNA-binding protein YhbY [Angelakisella sp.]|nr:ribosome assembly RNA-binding protein YhbY [Angelakisella sp.]